jgi:hypothetical protein
MKNNDVPFVRISVDCTPYCTYASRHIMIMIISKKNNNNNTNNLKIIKLRVGFLLFENIIFLLFLFAYNI